MTVTDLVAPSDIEAEMSVLGALMLDNRRVAEISSYVDIDDFYRSAHGVIYSAILDLHSDQSPIDIVTLHSKLNDKNQLNLVGGIAYLMQIGDFVPTTSNVMYYAERVKQVANRRQFISSMLTAASIAESNEDLAKAIEVVQTQKFSFESSSKKPKHIDEVLEDEMKDMFARNADTKTSISSGFSSIDNITGGWKPGELIILGARPSMGKSALALQWSINAATKGVPTLFASIEMSLSDVSQRIMAVSSSIHGSRLRHSILHESEKHSIRGVRADMYDMPLFLIGENPCSLQVLRSRAMQLKSSDNLQVLLVDYLQMITTKGSESRSSEIDAVSRGLKSLAQELDIAVIALASLNRGVEKRDDKRPIMSDLREAGGIEFDADKIAFLYRPMYYASPDARETSTEEDAEFIVTKNRNGSVGACKLTFRPQIPRFEEWVEGASWLDL